MISWSFLKSVDAVESFFSNIMNITGIADIHVENPSKVIEYNFIQIK